MTPEERAEKIIETHWGHCEGPYDLIPMFAAEIRAAVEEAIVDSAGMTLEEIDQEQQAAVRDIKAEAFEEAAKIADYAFKVCDCAEKIRAKANELGQRRSALKELSDYDQELGI